MDDARVVTALVPGDPVLLVEHDDRQRWLGPAQRPGGRQPDDARADDDGLVVHSKPSCPPIRRVACRAEAAGPATAAGTGAPEGFWREIVSIVRVAPCQNPVGRRAGAGPVRAEAAGPATAAGHGRARGLLARRSSRSCDGPAPEPGGAAGRAGLGGACVGSGRGARALAELSEEIVACRACPRLVAWREQVAREKRAAFRDEEYWGRPVPGFGDPDAADRPGRPGPGGPRREPDRADVHRGPLGRLPLRRAAPGRLRQSAHVGRRPATGCASRAPTSSAAVALRPAGEPADAEERDAAGLPGAGAGRRWSAPVRTSRVGGIRSPLGVGSSGSGPAPASATARRPRYRPGGQSSARSTRASNTSRS